MVNYLYDLDDIENNHEAFAEKGEVVASPAVQKHLKTGPVRALAQPRRRSKLKWRNYVMSDNLFDRSRAAPIPRKVFIETPRRPQRITYADADRALGPHRQCAASTAA